jgi:hypothetical protein
MLEQKIFDLEKQLLMPDIRQSAEKYKELFSNDFFEFGGYPRLKIRIWGKCPQ